jgi:pyruvate,water dikinase
MIENLISKDHSNLKEVRGNIAQPGHVTGVARLISTDREINKVKKDEILVCNLTNPNYDPVFAKIKGLVTDDGGILCHSAIMAREFKVPCIIGTKIATKVFKTGDIIELDAEKGIVKILK